MVLLLLDIHMFLGLGGGSHVPRQVLACFQGDAVGEHPIPHTMC